jgi:XTP/dITP diphosphohydrolase
MPRQRILIASNNSHKVQEFRRLLASLPVDLVTPRDLGLDLDVQETGATFEDNARIKAHAFAEASGLPALADDSGIEVDALGGRPGVWSARYGGPGLDDPARTQLLLREMADVPDGDRACRYRVVLVFAGPDGSEEVAEGRCEGLVAREAVGANGFGYDPIFYVPSFRRTIAQLDPAQKDAISHRGAAARVMARILTSRYSP